MNPANRPRPSPSVGRHSRLAQEDLDPAPDFLPDPTHLRGSGCVRGVGQRPTLVAPPPLLIRRRVRPEPGRTHAGHAPALSL